ncbi:MAG: hypothetical protein ABIT71_16730 [Vicinamibacteraceae bacterium]
MTRLLAEAFAPWMHSPRRASQAAAVLACVIVAGPSLAALAPPSQTAALPPTLTRHLGDEGFVPADLEAIAGGRVIARGLPRADRDEAGAIGVVRINLSPDAFLARFRDIVRFERGGGVESVGRFSVPAVVGDLDGYVLPAQDAIDIAACALDDCDVNLSATQITRLRSVDGRGPGGRARLTYAARQALTEYVADYQRRGNEALAVYRDREPAFALREASARLLRQSIELHRMAPAIAFYLDRYPAVPLPPGAEEFFYWSVMSFGMKPITRANHVVVMPVTSDGLAGFVAASRTIYASHYFRDGLEVKYVVPVSQERSAFYLLSVNRSHSESLMGMKGLLLGGKIRSSARSGVERHVLHVKSQAERPAP